jgi:hypothetical protein
MPSHHRALACARRRSVRLLFGAVAMSMASALFAASAGAAPPTPESSASCWGSLTKDPAATPTSDDPNLLDYTFRCNAAISAYTLIVNRGLSDFENVDDFSTTVDVVDHLGSTVPTASFTCEGTLPGNGVNCNAGAGGLMPIWDNTKGTFDLSDPYCKNIPAGSRPGTLAEPRAVVQLIVTDWTGAQDGPFRINLSSACPAVPDRVPPVKHKTKPKPKKGHKASHHKNAGHK